MSPGAFDAAGTDAPLDALAHALAGFDVVPERALFLRARAGGAMARFARTQWLHEQTFRPAVDRLQRLGHLTGSPASGDRFPLVLVLPPRQRDEARALFAGALDHLADDGVLIASVANNEGAKSAQADLARLCGGVTDLSKHKCRVFWTHRRDALIDEDLRRQWITLDGVQPIAGGRFISRPGLFAWDRIDAASALLAAHLPASLSGRAADLGAGYGFLAQHLVNQCPGVSAIDLYEAEARAIESAQINMAACQRRIPAGFHWHDVTTGLPHTYDVIVSNPPFHQHGRAEQPELGRAFIRAAADALAPHGQFWLVANRHLPYEATLGERFAQVRIVADRSGFKVMQAQEPRR